MVKKVNIPITKYVSIKEVEASPEDAIDKIMAEIAKQKAQEVKMASLKKFLAETEIERIRAEEELKKAKSSSEQSEVKDDELVILARQLAEYPEDKRKEILQIYAMLKASDKLGALSILPILASAKQENKSNEVLLAEIVRSIVEMNKNNPQTAELIKVFAELSNRKDSSTDLVKLVTDIISNKPQDSTINLLLELQRAQAEMFNKRLEELVQNLQPYPSPIERILTDEKLFERAKALFGGHSYAPDPELEKLKLEYQKALENIKMDMLKLQMDREERLLEKKHRWESEKERTQLIKDLFSGPFGNVISNIGNAAVDRIRNPVSVPLGAKHITVDKVTCPKCSKPFYADIASDYLVCPFCGVVLAKSGGKKEVSREVENAEANDTAMGTDEVPGELDSS